jgi:hypothetical protein
VWLPFDEPGFTDWSVAAALWWLTLFSAITEDWNSKTAMPITPFLRNQAFDPEALDAMSLAFTNVCKTLGLSDRSDKLTEIVANHVIEWAQRGVLDPIELAAATLRGIKAE